MSSFVDEHNQGLSGHVRTLYNTVSRLADNPSAEIEEMGHSALEEGVITDNMYKVLRHRTPFPGYEHLSLRRLEKIPELSLHYRRIWQLEKRGALLLANYINGKVKPDKLKLRLTELPLRHGEIAQQLGKVALLKVLGFEVTVEDALRFFNKHAETNTPIVIKYYTQKAHEAIHEVFERIGVELPQVIVY